MIKIETLYAKLLRRPRYYSDVYEILDSYYFDYYEEDGEIDVDKNFFYFWKKLNDDDKGKVCAALTDIVFNLIRSEKYKKEIIENIEMVIDDELYEHLCLSASENYKILYETIYQSDFLIDEAIKIYMKKLNKQ